MLPAGLARILPEWTFGGQTCPRPTSLPGSASSAHLERRRSPTLPQAAAASPDVCSCPSEFRDESIAPHPVAPVDRSASKAQIQRQGWPNTKTPRLGSLKHNVRKPTSYLLLCSPVRASFGPTPVFSRGVIYLFIQLKTELQKNPQTSCISYISNCASYGKTLYMKYA